MNYVSLLTLKELVEHRRYSD